MADLTFSATLNDARRDREIDKEHEQYQLRADMASEIAELRADLAHMISIGAYHVPCADCDRIRAAYDTAPEDDPGRMVPPHGIGP